jgi:NAD(P)-dependent dehydrogenase (short-subunit alcohol dehydrogenase family)
VSIYEELFSVAGKTALVTGGAKGVGAFIAESLVRAGCQVFVTGRSREAGEAFARRMEAHGACTFLQHDLSSPVEIQALVAELGRRAGMVDILVNNAGAFSAAADIASVRAEDWDSLMALNLRTPFLLVQGLVPLLTARASSADPARVINIGSIGGLMPQSNGAYAYGCSKAAIHQLTRMLASDLRASNINVNAIAPGFFPSDMTAGFFDAMPDLEQAVIQKIPAHRLGSAEDLGGMVIFLCSRAGAYLTGTITQVDGGLLCAP